jgi:cation transport ATPase
MGMVSGRQSAQESDWAAPPLAEPSTASDMMEAIARAQAPATAGSSGRSGVHGVERALWISAALTALLAAMAAVRRQAAGALDIGLTGGVLVGLEIGLGTLLLMAGGGRYFVRAVQSVLRGRVDRFTLLGVGLGATFVHGVISAWAPPALLAPAQGGAMVHALPSLAMAGAMLTLLLLGDWLERCEGLSILAPPPGQAGKATGHPSLARAPFVPALNQLSRWLLWLAVAVSVASFAAWALWGPEPRAGYSLMSALSALIAACPAALGLVAPIAVRAAMDRAGQARIHFRGVEEIELLRRVDTVIIDAALSGLSAVDAEAVRGLHREGMRLILLTPGRRIDAEAVARRLGIEDVRAEVSHPERVEQIHRLRAGGRTVAMLCEAREDPGVTREVHLVIAAGGRGWAPGDNPGLRLDSGSLVDLVRARRLSRATVGNIKENISFTFVSSLLAVPLAAGALFPWNGLHAGPLAAALAAGLSAVAVILNSLRLRYARF